MKAVVVERGRPVVVERAAPHADGDASIRVILAGICGTDLEIARGYLDFRGILGHEFVGIVDSAPDREWIGRRVVGEINVGCGQCERCASGWQRHCPRRSVLGIVGRDGAFAEMLCLPLTNLHAVPDGVPDAAAVFTEPLAAAYEMLEQVPASEGEHAIVLGDGRLGQLCAVVLARAGCAVVLEGRHTKKMARLERFGISTALAGASFGRRFDRVVEATGSPLGLERALELVRPRGTIILKSTYHGVAEVNLAGLVIDEVVLVGSRCGPFSPAIEHLASDSTIVDDMISARFPLEQAPEAFARACDSESLKVVLAP